MPSVSVRDVIKAVFKDIDDKDENTGEAIGFDKLNASIGGFNPGELILVIGKPDTGKTEFCIKMAQYLAVKKAMPMIIFSPAMSATLLTEHLLSSISGVKLQRIKSGFMDDNDWNLLVSAIGSLGDASIHINDSAELTIDEIREEVGALKRRGAELAIIDYFNPIKREEGDVYGKNDMKETVFSLKKIAQDFNISVMAVFQFLGTAKGMGLNLSDLKKYGITEDALDTAIFISRQSKPYICHPEEYVCGSRHIAEISVLKLKKNIKTKFSFYSGVLKFRHKSKICTQISPT